MQPTLFIMHHQQRGFSLLTLIVGFLLGLIVAAGVSFYINNAPVPFIDRTSGQNNLEVPSDWNPNAALQHGTTTVATPPPPLSNNNSTESLAADPLAPATVGTPSGTSAGAGTGTNTSQPTTPERSVQFFVQAGAFSSQREAEQQRARLALLGTQATISQVSAAGQTVHRVRMGPYTTRGDATSAVQKLTGNGIEATVIAQ